MTSKTTHTPDSSSRILGWVPKTLAALLMLLVASYPLISEADTERTRRPLDLPSGGNGSDSDDDDDPLPDLIQFFGHDYEGDAFVWVLDISGSMSVGGRIAQLRDEFAAAVVNLSTSSDFGAVAFNQNILPLDPLCSASVAERKRNAIIWVTGLQPSGASCVAPAVIHGLELVRKSRKPNRRVIVVGDGLPECGGVSNSELHLEHIESANWDRIPIDTVFVGIQLEAGIDFFQQLANSNDGTMVIAQ